MSEAAQQQPDKKIALITGANKGIGFHVASELGRQGMTVLIAARNPELGQQATAKLRADGIDAHALTLDVTDAGTIAAAFDEVSRRFGHLDVLINNAGIADRGEIPLATAPLATVERIWRTNFLGALAVAQAALPLLKKAPAARIVNVSSGLGSLTLHSDPTWEYASIKAIGYCSSKAALNMLTVQLAYELRETAVKVNSADPGYTATDLNGHSGPQTIAEGSEAILRLATLPTDGPTGGFFDRHGAVPW